jgi:hypothetical protein
MTICIVYFGIDRTEENQSFILGKEVSKDFLKGERIA